jgi:general secretion pathway protein I
MKSSGKLKDKKGFTLLEVVVALTIAAIAFPTLLQAFSNGAKQQSLIENRITAVFLLRLRMAEIEMEGYSSLASGEGEFTADSRFKWACEVSDTDTEGLKEVTVTVTWQERGKDQSISLTTYMADRRIKQQES